MSGSGREALPDIREGILTIPGHPRGPSGHPGEFPDHSRTSERAARPLPDIREGLRRLPDIRQGLLTTLGHPGGPPDHSQTTGRASHTIGRVTRQLPDILKGLPPLRASRSVSRPFTDLRDGHSNFREGLPTTPGHSGGPPYNRRTSRRAS